MGLTIVIFNTFYYPKFVGGAEISVQLLAEGLVKSGNKVFVITSGKTASAERINGVIVIRIKQRNIFSTYNESKRPALLKSIWHLLDSCNPLNFFLISGLLKRIKPTVVHTNNIQGFSPFIWAIVKRQQLPLVHTLRDYYLMCHRTNLYNNDQKCDSLCSACKLTYHIKKNFAGYPDCYIGISHFILEKHLAYFPMHKQPTDVVYNPVEIPNKTPVRLSEGKVVFGFMGRIAKAKGVEYLVRELVKVKKEFRPLFKIVFAGKGEEKMIRQLQNELNGIEFEFPGLVKPAEFYRNIDVLIVPSLWHEPFGRIVIESLSYSIPVCIAQSGGLKELHHPECTWSFVSSEGKLHLLVEHILENKQEIWTKREFCRRHVKRFSQSNNVQNYLDVYSRLNPAPPNCVGARVSH